MNKNKIVIWQISAILFSIVIGTILHFTYKWSNQNVFIAAFSAINESIWEHLKLVFYPMLLFAIIEGFFIYSKSNNYIEAKTIALFFSILFIIISFYTYTGVIGKSIFYIDILIFILSIILGEYICYKFFITTDKSTKTSKILSLLLIVVLLVCFIVFSYNTPKINIFKHPVAEIYRRKIIYETKN